MSSELKHQTPTGDKGNREIGVSSNQQNIYKHKYYRYKQLYLQLAGTSGTFQKFAEFKYIDLNKKSIYLLLTCHIKIGK